MNILDSLKGLVTDELVSKAAGALGEDSGAISKVIGGALPTILGGLMNSNSDSHSALSGLFGTAAKNDNLMGDLLGGLTGGGNQSGGMMDSIVSGIFGDKVGGVVNILTNLGGLKNSGSSKSILGIVGSLAASYFGKKMMKDGLGFGSILNLIGGEKESIMKAAPAGVADAMGISSGPWDMIKDVVGNVTGAVTGTASAVVDGAVNVAKGAAGVAGAAVNTAGDVVDGTVETAKSGMKWLWPLLLLAALAAGIIYFMKGCNDGGMKDGVENVVDGAAGAASAVVDGAENVVDGAVDAAGNAVDGVVDGANAIGGAVAGTLDDAGNWIASKGAAISLKLENGTELATTKGSVTDRLYNFLNSDAPADKMKAENWFNFEDVLFKTGSSNLKAGSETQLKNAVAILKAFPNVKVKLGGYTDNTGSEDVNIKISNARAKTVYNKMLGMGATAASFDAKPYEGYGPQHPVCPANDTDACKAQNRRIAIVVTEK